MPDAVLAPAVTVSVVDQLGNVVPCAGDISAIELEKAEYAAATKSSDVYDGASSNGSDAETENAVHPKTIENNLGRKPLGGGSGQVVKLPAIGKTGLPPVGRLPKISAGVAGQGSGSGFRSAGYTAPTSVDFTPAVNSLSVREAAAAAAASQKNMLKEPEDEGSPEVSAAETKAFGARLPFRAYRASHATNAACA